MTNKLFPPLTYSIQNGEPIIDGYTMEKPNRIDMPNSDNYFFDKWKQSKVAVKVDKETNHRILLKLDYQVFSSQSIKNSILHDAKNGINIDFLADRIEVREERILLAKSGGYKEGSEIKQATIIEGKPYKVTYTAFLLPEKKEDELTELLEIVDKKMYSIEQIEKAIDMSVLENYQIEILKREIINNLTMINTEGYNVNPQFNEVYKHIMRFKLNSLLSEAHFRGKSIFSLDEFKSNEATMEQIAKHHFVKQMADKIIQVKGKIDFEPSLTQNQIELSCELLVFNPKQFKLIVEHTIKELSQETLDTIRNNPNQ